MGKNDYNALRKTGIPFINDIPWGTHICSFYETENDLISIVVPYFKAGLENNEFCMWIVSEPNKVYDAFTILKDAIPDFASYLSQIKILSHNDWYLKNGNFLGDKVVKGWADKVRYAIGKGYDGIRICGNTTWLDKRYWKAFMDYELEVEEKVGSLNMIALCPYQLGQCGIH